MSEIEVTVGTDPDPLTEPTWDGLADEAGTIFHTARFLLPWWRDASPKRPDAGLTTVRMLDNTTPVGQCVFETHDDVLRFAGGDDVVDYMGPVAAAGHEENVATALVDVIRDGLPWRTARLAGLRDGATLTRCLVREITDRFPAAKVEIGERAPRIRGVAGGYLAHLSSKRRGDVLRKRNRLTEAVGEVHAVHATSRATLDRLLDWKTRDAPDFVASYGGFLHDMFTGLAAVGAARIVELRAGDRPLASAIVLTHRHTTYLYNMSYDVSLTTASATGIAPGVVLVSLLAEQAVDSGWEFDFLKGTQDYKLRLGGIPEDLLTITLSR